MVCHKSINFFCLYVGGSKNDMKNFNHNIIERRRNVYDTFTFLFILIVHFCHLLILIIFGTAELILSFELNCKLTKIIFI